MCLSPQHHELMMLRTQTHHRLGTSLVLRASGKGGGVGERQGMEVGRCSCPKKG